MVLSQRFKFYFVFCIVVVLSTYGLSSFYRHDVIRCLVVIFYLCGGNSYRQSKFDESKISNYVMLKNSDYLYYSYYFIKFNLYVLY